MVRFLILIVFLCSGCLSTTIKPFVLEKSDLPVINEPVFESIIKPEKPDYVLLDTDFKITTDENNYFYVAFNYDNFVKIIALSKSFDKQSDLINTQRDYINNCLKDISLLKDLVQNKDNQLEKLNSLYTEEQRLRIYQVNELEKENWILRGISLVELGILILILI